MRAAALSVRPAHSPADEIRIAQAAVVIVTHDVQQAERVAHRLAFMYLGELVEDASVEDLLERPRAQCTRLHARSAHGPRVRTVPVRAIGSLARTGCLSTKNKAAEFVDEGSKALEAKELTLGEANASVVAAGRAIISQVRAGDEGRYAIFFIGDRRGAAPRSRPADHAGGRKMTADGEPTLVHETPSEQCTSCESPLAADQRYCLQCGTRRAERRVPVEATRASSRAPESGAGRSAPVGGPLAVQRLGGVWGVAALLLLALGVGVIIGGLGGDDAPVASKPPEVTIAAAALGPTASAPPVASTAPAADEWPAQDGFTVQLGELPKAGTDQAAADAAKAAASAKGAAAPGVLDAGAHGLTDGQLVLYSGVFSTRRQATAALDGLKAAYPDARVVEVKATSSASGATTGGASGDGASSTPSKPATVSKSKLKETEKLDPEAFQKQSKKLPKTTATPGKAPPKDNAPPGGGTEAETIG